MLNFRIKLFPIISCIGIVLLFFASYLLISKKSSDQKVLGIIDKPAVFLSIQKKNTSAPDLKHCTTNSVNPFSGSLPEYCFGSPSAADNEISHQANVENEDDVDPNSKVSLSERVAGVLNDLRRGDFNSANDYIELTNECRMGVAFYGAVAEAKNCSAQDLNFLDNELKNLLIMGVNQRNPQAEFAWSSWWYTQAMVNLEKVKALYETPLADLTGVQKAQLQEFKNAFTKDLNTSKEILSVAQGHNPAAEEKIKELTDSGLLTAFSPDF